MGVVLAVMFMLTALDNSNVKKNVTKSNEQLTKDSVSVKQASSVNITEKNISDSVTKKKTSKFSGTFSAFLNTDNKEVESETKNYSTDLRLIAGYKFHDHFKISSWIEIGKDLSTSYEEKIKDTKVMLTFGSFKLTEKLTFSPGTSFVLPTSEDSKRRDELNLGWEVINPHFSYKLTDRLSFTYLPRVKANFHEYKTNRVNKVNTQYQLVSFYILALDITDKWYSETGLVYVNSWSYMGTEKDPQYQTYLETGYEILDKTNFIIGALTGGTHYNVEYGKDSDIELYDEGKTTYYGKFSRSF